MTQPASTNDLIGQIYMLTNELDELDNLPDHFGDFRDARRNIRNNLTEFCKKLEQILHDHITPKPTNNYLDQGSITVCCHVNNGELSMKAVPTISLMEPERNIETIKKMVDVLLAAGRNPCSERADLVKALGPEYHKHLDDEQKYWFNNPILKDYGQ